MYPHSKCVLMQAILADTEFLAQNAIMDYSLLTCIDDSTGELVVGIIGTYVYMRGGEACMWLIIYNKLHVRILHVHGNSKKYVYAWLITLIMSYLLLQE